MGFDIKKQMNETASALLDPNNSSEGGTLFEAGDNRSYEELVKIADCVEKENPELCVTKNPGKSVWIGYKKEEVEKE